MGYARAELDSFSALQPELHEGPEAGRRFGRMICSVSLPLMGLPDNPYNLPLRSNRSSKEPLRPICQSQSHQQGGRGDGNEDGEHDRVHLTTSRSCNTLCPPEY